MTAASVAKASLYASTAIVTADIRLKQRRKDTVHLWIRFSSLDVFVEGLGNLFEYLYCTVKAIVCRLCAESHDSLI